MSCQDEAKGNLANLRQRAEEIIGANKPPLLEFTTPEEAGRALQELYVHQIELQMQNEELRRAQVELDAVRARYFDLYDLAPVGYVTASKKGMVLEANLTAARLLGMERGALVKRPLARFVVPADADIYYLQLKQLWETGLKQVFEVRMVRPDGAQFWARLEAVKAEDDEDAPVSRVVISDITERKHAEEAIQRSDLMRLSFDAIIVWRLDAAIESWNRGAGSSMAMAKTRHWAASPMNCLGRSIPGRGRKLRRGCARPASGRGNFATTPKRAANWWSPPGCSFYAAPMASNVFWRRIRHYRAQAGGGGAAGEPGQTAGCVCQHDRGSLHRRC